MRRVGALLAASIAGAAAQAMNCLIDLPDLGVTYDLTPLSGQPIHVNDFRNDSTSATFDYYFGVCNDLSTYPSSLVTPASMCTNTSNDDGSQGGMGAAPAFQVGKTFPLCKRLGDHASNGQLVVFGAQNPRWRFTAARGVGLRYTNGDKCQDPYNSSNFIPRSLFVEFQCYDNPVVTQMNLVDEDVQCTYHVTIKHQAGCPLQCPFVARNGFGQPRLCGGNGICGYDVTGGYAKCFCNKGYSGRDCTTPGDKGLPAGPSFAPNIAGGFFGGLLGGLIATVGFFMIKAKLAGNSLMDGVSDIMTGAIAVSLPFSMPGMGGSSGAYKAAPAGEPMFGGGAGAADFASATTGYIAPDVGSMAPPVYPIGNDQPFA